MKALSKAPHHLVIGAMSFLLVVRGPLNRGFTTAQIAGIVYVAAMLMTLVIGNRKARFTPRMISTIVTLSGLWAIFALSLLVGSLRGTIDSHQGIRDFRDYSVFAMMTVACLIDSNAYHRAPLAPVIVGGGLGITLELASRGTALYGRAFYEPLLGYRYTAGFSSPNEYGAFCSIILAMAVGQWLSTTSRRKALGLLWFAAAAIIACISTFSRGSMLGAGIAVVVVLVLWAIDARRNRNRRDLFKTASMLWVAALAGIFIAASASLVPFSVNWKAALAYRFQDHIRIADLAARQSLATAALKMGMEYPVLGAGLGAFSSQSAACGGSATLSPHNELAKSFAEAGMLGCLFTGVLFIKILVQAFLNRKTQDGYAILGGVVAFTVAEQFFSHLVRPSLPLVFAIIAAASSLGDRQSHP